METEFIKNDKTKLEMHLDFDAEAKFQKLRVMAEMSASIAHEVNNPLTIIVAKAHQSKELLEAGLSKEQLKPNLDKIIQNAYRITNIIRALNLFARSRDLNTTKEFVSADQLIEDTLSLISPALRKSSVVLDINSANLQSEVFCDRCEIVQILVNLMNNAIDALVFCPSPKIQIEVLINSLNKKLSLKVKDNGMGIKPEHLPKIFDSYYTTKSDQNGLGLGLSISKHLAIKNKGTLTAATEDDGTVFTLELPMTNIIHE